MPVNLRIATRGSALALWQAEHTKALLLAHRPDLQIDLVIVTSHGDVVTDRPLYQVGGVGIFTKEVQDAVLDGRADLAVHSLKDLPTQSHPTLCLAAVPERGLVADALISPKFGVLDNLPIGARLATSSLRRKAQLLRWRPDIQIVDVRGNVETRIRKLKEQDLDGLLLAQAGLVRLGLQKEITQILPYDLMLPAVGQGALGIECRRDDQATQALLSTIDHPLTRQAVSAEREFLRVLEGGCQVPIGTLTNVKCGQLTLDAIALSTNGADWIRDSLTGPATESERLGRDLAQKFLDQGASRFLLRVDRPS